MIFLCFHESLINKRHHFYGNEQNHNSSLFFIKACQYFSKISYLLLIIILLVINYQDIILHFASTDLTVQQTSELLPLNFTELY